MLERTGNSGWLEGAADGGGLALTSTGQSITSPTVKDEPLSQSAYSI